MTDPSVLSRHALDGLKVALSVSRSADLLRLGLTETHCRLVVAEIARAVVLAGGTVMYGGHLEKTGYTEILLNEAQRYQESNEAFRVYLAEPVYREISLENLSKADQRLGAAGSLTLIDGKGSIVPIPQAHEGSQTATPAAAFTAMRTVVSVEADARVAVGGMLADYQGSEPGVIEETRLSVAKGAPLYVAAGYGGAGFAIARQLGIGTTEDWAPAEVPLHGADEAVAEALTRLEDAMTEASRKDGLGDDERRILSETHRPGDIATLVVRGLARVASAA